MKLANRKGDVPGGTTLMSIILIILFMVILFFAVRKVMGGLT